MIGLIFRKIFGSRNDREVKRLRPLVARINQIEQELQSQPESVLREKTAAWKARLSTIQDNDELKRELEALIPEAFAVVKNACRRLCGTDVEVRGHAIRWEMVPFDVQLIGGMGLHLGRIAEMATGEGKTLVGTMPVYLNALTGRGVHVVTVNDYLAARDSDWMGHVYTFLGLSVGCILHDQPPSVRREMYQCDITYGTNAEFGFDYLRDNGMATRKEEQVQRGHYFAIVDEVDSILIDEARTPLIISGPAVVSMDQKFVEFKPAVQRLVQAQQELCNRFLREAEALIPKLRPENGVPPKNAADLEQEVGMLLYSFVLPDLPTLYHQIDTSTELDAKGRMEAKGGIQAQFEEKAGVIHALSQLLKAYCLYERDVQYVVQDNKVIIVDEHTGRLMSGRRWSEGLHQAVEAKENVQIERETQTLATITIQNYFRLYTKLAGMTGTAETEAQEFFDIYKLGVLTIPTNRPNIRKDSNDTVYKTRREKFNAVLKELKELHTQGRPILVGTISVESSEMLSRMLKKEGIVHSVLNAKYHEQEAEIVARAGQKGSLTIATNMAGRGTDIKLGAGVAELGGLHVLCTERHESRRIDRQLRGRCSRQGDPGSSHFFISLEDDLMRLFGSERITKVMERMGLEEGQELEHPLLNRSIQTAQKRVEGHYFQQRKRTLEYDDVMNKQREVVYGFRNDIIHADDVRDRLMDIMEEVVLQKVEQFTHRDSDPGDWDIRGMADWVNLNFPLGMPEEEILKAARAGKVAPVEGSMFDGLSEAQFSVLNFISKSIRESYELKVSFERIDALTNIERYTILDAIDRLWQEHLYGMDSLRNSIGLRAYGQRDPLIEYKAEAFKLFDALMVNIKSEICHNIFRSASSLMAFEQFLHNLPQTTIHETAAPFHDPASMAESSNLVSEANEVLSKAQPVHAVPRVGRNDVCPCGSGKKYKTCCGQ